MRRTRSDALGRRIARSLLPPAVVLDVSFVNGLEAIRSLAAAGAPVIAVDHREGALGFRSRLAHHALAPDPKDGEAYVAFLAELAEQSFSEPAVVFPTHDAPLELVARNAGRLAAYQLPGSGWDVLEPLQSKRHQYAVAEGAGIGVPLTFAADTEAQAQVAGGAQLSRRRQAGRSDPVQAALRAPGDRLQHAGRADRGLAQRGRLRAAPAGGHSRRRCDALDGRLLHGRLGQRARRLLRPQARADAARLRYLPHRRDSLALRCRRAGAGAARCAGFPRHRADGVPARPARRPLQADGGEPAPVAVARAGAGLRRRPAAHRLLRRARPFAEARRAPARSTTAAAGPSLRRTCARHGRRARRCGARCASSGPAPWRARSTCATRCPRSCRPAASSRRRSRGLCTGAAGARRDLAAALARPPAAGDARRHDLAQAALGAGGR